MVDTSTLEYVWHPSEALKAQANWTAFIRAAGLPDYQALEKKAAEDPEWYWDALIRHRDFRFYQPYRKVRDLSEGIPFAKWCGGGTTNLVLNALDKKTAADRAHPAVIWESETGEVRRWSYAELDAQTCRLANALAGLGYKKGDVIGLYMPMLPEAVAAFLAVAKLGCIILPLFSGFGADALASRLTDGGAVGVITADGMLRRGQQVPMKAVLDHAVPQVPGLRHVVVVRRLGMDLEMQPGRDLWWHELTAQQPAERATEQVDAEHPLMVIYTSGTTGRPKGIVHTHCGFGVKMVEDAQLCWDFKPDDRFLWMVDLGWIAGPMMIVGSLLAGAAMVLAEGVPDYPQTSRYWRMAQDHGATRLGIVPSLARGMRKYGDAEVGQFDLSSLRAVLSSAEPWDQESWMWVFEKVCGRRAPIFNFTGGTEMICLVTTNILFPMKPGGFYGGLPGMGADVVDAQGNSVGPGEMGELVMREAAIGTTRGLWRDRQRYLESYWLIIPGMWVQGDFASRDTDGVWFLHGRSDDTIKVSGKRVGPSELEQILMATGAVAEAAVVGVPHQLTGSALVCVVVPAPGESAGEALRGRLSQAIVQGMGASFRPREIVFVSDLPKTRSMKVMRRVVRAVLTGQPAGDLSSLVNPEAVEELKVRTGGV